MANGNTLAQSVDAVRAIGNTLGSRVPWATDNYFNGDFGRSFVAVSAMMGSIQYALGIIDGGELRFIELVGLDRDIASRAQKVILRTVPQSLRSGIIYIESLYGTKFIEKARRDFSQVSLGHGAAIAILGDPRLTRQKA